MLYTIAGCLLTVSNFVFSIWQAVALPTCCRYEGFLWVVSSIVHYSPRKCSLPAAIVLTKATHVPTLCRFSAGSLARPRS